jgi:hypothetical protein
MKNCVRQNHIALQLKFKKILYTTIVQLSHKKYMVLVNKLPRQKNQLVVL